MRYRRCGALPTQPHRVASVAGILLLILFSLPIAVEPRIKQRLLNALGERFDSEVQLETLTVSLFPRPRLSGRGLVLRHKQRTDVPPLVTIASFSGEAGLVGLLSDPVRISNIRLEGLEINVPPGGMSLNHDEPDEPGKSDQPDRPTGADDNDGKASPLIVRNLQSERAVLRILRRDPGKAPRVFEIGQLDMRDVGADHPWPFRANLTNPTPPGRILTEGTFGPWQAEEPSQTPLAASYRFENADLGVFNGIAGILNSSGAFKGVLQRIEVDGTTSMAAFALADVGNGMPLETRFHSMVDGTNGNTLLQPVEATLGGTKIHATGGVVEREGEDGRTVELDVVIDAGRLEDILRLAVKGPQPPMTGAMTLKTKFLLPPGDRDVIQKLRLDGDFSVDRAEFTKAQVRVGAGVRAEIPAAVTDRGQRIGDLARRAVHEGELRPRLRELAAVLLARVQQPARRERVVGHAVAVELAGRRGGRELVLVGKDLAVRDRESPQLASAERDERDLDGRRVQALAVKGAVGAAVSIRVGEHAADLLRCGTEVVGTVHGGLRRGAQGQEERDRYGRSECE